MGAGRELDARPHGEHGLRAGRGRRRADQPHPLQPVLPRKARLLPGERGDLRVREPRLRRPARAAALLQPPDRDLGLRRRGAAARGWSADVLDVVTAEDAGEPRTNWSVARVRRNVGRRAQWGAILTARTPAGGET